MSSVLGKRSSDDAEDGAPPSKMVNMTSVLPDDEEEGVLAPLSDEECVSTIALFDSDGVRVGVPPGRLLTYERFMCSLKPAHCRIRAHAVDDADWCELDDDWSEMDPDSDCEWDEDDETPAISADDGGAVEWDEMNFYPSDAPGVSFTIMRKSTLGHVHRRLQRVIRSFARVCIYRAHLERYMPKYEGDLRFQSLRLALSESRCQADAEIASYIVGLGIMLRIARTRFPPEERTFAFSFDAFRASIERLSPNSMQNAFTIPE